METLNGKNVRTVLAAKWEGSGSDGPVRECADGIGSVELEDGSVLPALLVGRFALVWEADVQRWRALPTRVLGERPTVGGGAVVTVAARPVYCQPDAQVRFVSRSGLVSIEVRRGIDEHASASVPAVELRRMSAAVLEATDRDALMMLVRAPEDATRAKADSYLHSRGVQGSPRDVVASEMSAAFVHGYHAALMELLRMTGGVR
jgi:hypothetical protein